MSHDLLPIDPEQRLVYALARADATPTVPVGLDWARVLRVAQQVGAGVALAQALPRLGLAGQPAAPDAAVEAAVRRVGMAGTFAQRYLLGRLQASVAALGAAGIRCMPIKGAAYLLADPDGALSRTMGDIDLLVAEADLGRARAVLLGTGWVAGALEAKAEFYAGHHHLPPLEDAQRTGLSIELHAEPFPRAHPFGIDAAALWRTAQPHPSLPGVHLPSPRLALLHACIHFAWSHMAEFGAWRLARDVDALSRAPGLDWPAFVREARMARASTAAYWSLRLAAELGGVEVPPAVLSSLAPAQSAELRDRLMRHLVLLAASPGACPSRLLRQVLWRAMLQPVRQGHGRARPWTRNAEFGGERAEGAPGVLGRLRRAAAALRYVERALGAGTRSPRGAVSDLGALT